MTPSHPRPPLTVSRSPKQKPDNATAKAASARTTGPGARTNARRDRRASAGRKGARVEGWEPERVNGLVFTLSPPEQAAMLVAPRRKSRQVHFRRPADGSGCYCPVRPRPAIIASRESGHGGPGGKDSVMIHPTAVIAPNVRLGANVRVGPYAVLSDCDVGA